MFIMDDLRTQVAKVIGGSEIQSYKTELQTRVTHYDVISRVTNSIIFNSIFQLELVTRENKKCKKSRVSNSGNDVIMCNSGL